MNFISNFEAITLIVSSKLANFKVTLYFYCYFHKSVFLRTIWFLCLIYIPLRTFKIIISYFPELFIIATYFQHQFKLSSKVSYNLFSFLKVNCQTPRCLQLCRNQNINTTWKTTTFFSRGSWFFKCCFLHNWL